MKFPFAAHKDIEISL